MRLAPFTFVTATIIGVVIGFSLNEVLHQERMAVLKEESDYLRQRAGILPSKNKYVNLTNRELRPQAKASLTKFRDFIKELNLAYDGLYAEDPSRPGVVRDPTDEKAREFDNKFLAVGLRFQDRYDRTLKIDLILLRQAMQSRVPTGVSSMPEERYQHTNMNTFVLRDLADDFERLLKNLP